MAPARDVPGRRLPAMRGAKLAFGGWKKLYYAMGLILLLLAAAAVSAVVGGIVFILITKFIPRWF